MLAITIAAVAATSHAGPCPPGRNLADTDGDGLFDHACVGDWNEDGSCQMEEDIRAAIRDLDDPGDKTVELAACDFSAPSTAQDYWAIVEVPNRTTVLGSGPETVLNGFGAADVTSRQAVLSNQDRVTANNIVIRDLTIDGGWRDGDATGFGHHRMGVYFSSCDQCRAENLVVTDTLHSCLYANNSDGIEFLSSTLRRCGNYTGLGNSFPCVYLFASDGHRLTNVTVSGIDCDGSGAAAFNTRRASENATLTQIVFQDNSARNTRLDATGAPKHCINVSGVRDAAYLNNVCTNTGGFASVFSDRYYTVGGDHNASASILVDGLEIHDSLTSRAPVTIESNSENFTLRNVTVHGAAGSCVEIRAPVRNITLEDSTLEDCGIHGVTTVGGDATAQQIAIHHNTIDGVGADGIDLSMSAVAPSTSYSVSGNVIGDFGRGGIEAEGIRLTGNVVSSVVAGNTLVDVNRQATHGVHQDTPRTDPTLLCTNTCQGTLAPEACLFVPRDSSFTSDTDFDTAVDACDSDDDDDGILDVADNCSVDFNPLQGDGDDDGVGNACDNCVATANAAQADFDRDDEGDWCDTNDGLIYLLFRDGKRVAWQVEGGFSSWNLYRGDLRILTRDGTYTQVPGSSRLVARACAVAVPWYRDVTTPPAGAVSFFLATGVASDSESSLGADSFGTERPNDNPCESHSDSGVRRSRRSPRH